MTFSWKPLTDREFADVAGLVGSKIVLVGGVYWIKVRACFYRPLLPLQEHGPSSVRAPLLAKVGACQYPVAPNDGPNSYLNLLLFEKSREYSIASLDHKRRRQVKLANREFVIRTIDDVDEFKRQAHAVYLSFYNRTRYQVGSKRRDPVHFSAWADRLFKIPKLLILGAYRNGVLGGVSVSYLVGRTAIYATFFCDDEALDRYVPGMMLHTVREMAAASPEISQVFPGTYKGIRGLDEFYLSRGAVLVRQPARLDINPLARLLLRKYLPRQYRQLLGELVEVPSVPETEDAQREPIKSGAPDAASSSTADRSQA